MKNNIIIVCIFILFFNINFEKVRASEEFVFESNSIEFFDTSKNIIAKNGVTVSSNDGLKISAFTANYDKKSNFLILEKDIIINDKLNDLSLKSEKIIYDKNNEIINSKNETEIILNDFYTLQGEGILFDRTKLTISSKNQS